jgi:hypothetical protein
MNTIRVTPDNVHQYIGYEIRFKTRGEYIVRQIMSVSNTGKTIQIDHPDLQNAVQIVTRKVTVIIPPFI